MSRFWQLKTTAIAQDWLKYREKHGREAVTELIMEAVNSAVSREVIRDCSPALQLLVLGHDCEADFSVLEDQNLISTFSTFKFSSTD